ncbi:amino acid adenylation domain-containing protein [Croceifilum oryzae]|uniref:Amino acid adenylation domain-containing protein n=1 Tax=Croceifilum oryzae TaxID=1553429 RepID=A0AAJ1WU47_9BACL|nr:non-ribosomal peptide synthetase [Croceifilum oryzae]MDQ0418693.1 amino acid adenylation domain-containing protein [Croceifilum oryzae]
MEQHQLIQQMMAWNDTKIDFPQICLHQMFEQQARQRPDQIAVVMGSEQITYQQLNQRANQLAHYLQPFGVGPDVPVGVCMNRSIELVIALLGILKAGGAYVPIDVEAPTRRIEQILTEAKAPVCLSQSELKESLPICEVQLVFVNELEDKIASFPTETSPDSGVGPEHAVAIYYTSGSTGRPKGVINLHKGWGNKMHTLQRRFQLQPEETILHKTTITFDDTAIEIFWTLSVGARIALIEPGLHRDPEAIVDALIHYQACGLLAVPSVLNRVMDVMDHKKKLQLSKFRFAYVGGETLTSSMVRRHAELLPGKLYNTWGATEVSVDSTIHECSEADYNEEGAVCIGKPVDNNRVYILDGNMQPVDVGIVGDLYIAGIGVGKGYINDPERTAKSFMEDPFVSGEMMYRTGDRGIFREDGSIKFLGREDFQVKIRGIRVELGEIEATLLKHEKVKEAVVLLREDTPGNKRLVAYVVMKADQSEGDKHELREHLKEWLPLYMIPHFMMFLEKLPLNQNSKLDRKALPTPSSTRPDLGTDYIEPRNEMESYLAGVFEDVLKMEEVGVYDDFFELGGDSITATLVMTRLRLTIHPKIPLKVLFDLKHIAGLTHYFQENGWSLILEGIMGLQRVDRDQELPLSFAQERLWFIHKLDEEKPTYNEPVAYRICGDLQIPALHKALCEMVQRHESLRTTFITIGDHPVQFIAQEEKVELPLEDLSSVPAGEREKTLQMGLTKESRIPFRLDKAPLMRSKLFKMDTEEYVLFINMHHIITDAWSGVLFLEELGILYDAVLKKKPNPMDEPSFQYADFAAWQREWLQGTTLEEQVDFWKQELAGELPVLQLPTDYPRPAVQTFEGNRFTFHLDAELVDQIKQLGQQNEASAYMVLLAAFNILLHRYSRQPDILVGSPIANRNYPGLEQMIGFFVNTIIVRSEYSGDCAFHEYVNQMKEKCLNIYNHQDVPFEQLVRELQPERNPAYSPLVQVVFAFQNNLEEVLHLTDLQVSPVNVNTHTARYDLTLFLTETKQGKYAGIFEYNTALFKQETIERLCENFTTLLKKIVADPTQSLAQLPITSENQRTDILKWNETRVPFPENGTLHESIQKQVERTPDAPAVVFKGKSLTYRELDECANQLAHYLVEKGVGPKRVVGICMERSLDLIVGLYAILKAGGAFLPLDPEAPKARLSQILEDSEAVVCLSELAFQERVPHDTVSTTWLDVEWDRITLMSSHTLKGKIAPDDPISVYYTSGSTGKPKGVVNTQSGWMNRMCWMQNHFQLQPGETVLQKTTLTFDDAAVEVFWPLMQGGRVALIEPGMHRDPRAIIDAAIQYEAVHLQFVPSMLNLVLDEITEEDRRQLHAVRSTISSGEALSATTVRRFFEKIPGTLNNTWGATEVSIDSTIHVCCPEDVEEEGAVCIGKPIDNNRCYVLDEHLHPVPVGVVGDLYLAGVGVAMGYLNNPERTAKSFSADPFMPSERMYKTGDLGYHRPDGSLMFVGRADNQVKIRGMRVELGEIEAVLLKHENVKEAVVLVQEDEPGLKRLLAYVVPLNPKMPLISEEMRELVKQSLPDYMVPSFVMILEQMPLNANGKVDRPQLPRPDRIQHYTGVDYIEPQGPVEIMLTEFWREMLQIEKIGIHDNFFDLGGHSLLATQIVSRIRRQLGVELPLRDVFMKPTIFELAKIVEGILMEMIEGLSEEEVSSLLDKE